MTLFAGHSHNGKEFLRHRVFNFIGPYNLEFVFSKKIILT